MMRLWEMWREGAAASGEMDPLRELSLKELIHLVEITDKKYQPNYLRSANFLNFHGRMMRGKFFSAKNNFTKEQSSILFGITWNGFTEVIEEYRKLYLRGDVRN